MRITLKVFAMLRDYLPRDAEGKRPGNELFVEVPEGATVETVIAAYALPRQLVQLALVNGTYVPPSERAAHVLKEGDALAIWPPIAGG